MIIRIEPEAEAELEEAADRYEQSVPGLGRQFLAEMRQRTDEVAGGPHRFPPFSAIAGVRCAHATGRFPHLLNDRFDDADHSCSTVLQGGMNAVWSWNG